MKLLRNSPIPKFVIAIAFLYALYYPFLYLVLYLSTPAGYTFTGGRSMDDGILLYFMRSFQNDFANPWSYLLPMKTYSTTSFTTPLIYLPLGYLAYLLNIPYLGMHLIIEALVNFIFLVVIYLFIREFLDRRHTNLAFLLFTLSSGIAGFIYFLLALGGKYELFFDPSTIYYQAMKGSYDFFEAQGLIPITMMNRLYYTFPLICGFLELISFKRFLDQRGKRHLIQSGLFLGLAFAFYPIHGIAFALITFLMAAVSIAKIGFRQNWAKLSSLGVVYTISLTGTLPWIFSYLQNPIMFQFYAGTIAGRARLTYLVLAMSMNLMFVLYDFYKTTENRQVLIYLVLAVGSLISFEAFMLILQNDFFLNVRLPQFLLSFPSYSKLSMLLLTAVFFLLSLIEANSVRKRAGFSSGNLLFFYLWLALFTALSIAPAKLFFGLNTYRLVQFIWLPLAIISASGIQKVSLDIKNRMLKGKQKGRFPQILERTSGKGLSTAKRAFSLERYLTTLIVTVIIFISIFSFIFYAIFFVQIPLRDRYPTYVTNEDYDALVHLKSLPQGHVLSSPEIGFFLPFLTDKFSLLGDKYTVLDYDDKFNDYEKFFSVTTTHDERREILEKYRIDYVFQGYKESSISNGLLKLGAADGLELIFNNKGARIYRVSIDTRSSY